MEEEVSMKTATLLHVARLLGIEPTQVWEIQIIFYTIWIIRFLAKSEEDRASHRSAPDVSNDPSNRELRRLSGEKEPTCIPPPLRKVP
jgi:hypothetical protein